MKRFKGIFLVLVIILLAGLSSNAFAKKSDGGAIDNEGITRSHSRRDGHGGFEGPKLDYDGKTSGIGRELGGIVGGAAGGTIGSRIGGSKGGLAGGYIGGKIGSRAGDSWERRMNQRAHDKWNNKGRHGNAGWRFNLDEDEDY